MAGPTVHQAQPEAQPQFVAAAHVTYVPYPAIADVAVAASRPLPVPAPAPIAPGSQSVLWGGPEGTQAQQLTWIPAAQPDGVNGTAGSADHAADPFARRGPPAQGTAGQGPVGEPNITRATVGVPGPSGTEEGSGGAGRRVVEEDPRIAQAGAEDPRMPVILRRPFAQSARVFTVQRYEGNVTKREPAGDGAPPEEPR